MEEKLTRGVAERAPQSCPAILPLSVGRPHIAASISPSSRLTFVFHDWDIPAHPILVWSQSPRHRSLSLLGAFLHSKPLVLLDRAPSSGALDLTPYTPARAAQPDRLTSLNCPE